MQSVSIPDPLGYTCLLMDTCLTDHHEELDFRRTVGVMQRRKVRRYLYKISEPSVCWVLAYLAPIFALHGSSHIGWPAGITERPWRLTALGSLTALVFLGRIPHASVLSRWTAYWFVPSKQ